MSFYLEKKSKLLYNNNITIESEISLFVNPLTTVSLGII